MMLLRADRSVLGCREAGFSLVEFLAAIAILSLVSVMAVQTLGVSITQRRVMNQIDAEARALGWTLTLLRQDLEAALPMRFEPYLGVEAPAFDAPQGGTGFELSVSGHPRFPEEAGDGFARVSWNFDAGSGMLTRHVVPFLRSRTLGASERGQVLLTGVKSFSIEAIDEEYSSLDESAALDALPRGFHLRMNTLRHGSLSVQVTR